MNQESDPTYKNDVLSDLNNNPSGYRFEMTEEGRTALQKKFPEPFKAARVVSLKIVQEGMAAIDNENVELKDYSAEAVVIDENFVAGIEVNHEGYKA